MKFYLFSFIVESAVVRSEMELVLRCSFKLLISQCFMWSRAGCYYRLAFHRWLLIYQVFELTVINNDEGRNSIAAPLVQRNAARSNIPR